MLQSWKPTQKMALVINKFAMATNRLNNEKKRRFELRAKESADKDKINRDEQDPHVENDQNM